MSEINTEEIMPDTEQEPAIRRLRLSEAIRRADTLRPNAIEDELKAAWLAELDCGVAELLNVEMPVNDWPEDRELLMPEPKTTFYIYYLCAMIDYYLREGNLYYNDVELFNSAYEDACGWYRRNNPKSRYYGNWRVM